MEIGEPLRPPACGIFGKEIWECRVIRPYLSGKDGLVCIIFYKNVSMLEDVVNAYAANDLPLDTQWSDIDYLDNYKDFTYDPVNFKDLPAFVDGLHKKNMHYIPIIDAGIA
jgi:hypothetical protein